MINKLTADEQMVLSRVTAKPELQPHFFSKIKNLKWFSELKIKGLLEPSQNPKPMNTEEEYWKIPSWPVTEYLVRSAETFSCENNFEYATEYIDLIRKVTNYAKANAYSNHRTWRQFAKICRLLPIQLITTEDIELIDYWLDDRFDRLLVARELGKWVEILLDSPDLHTKKISLLLINKLFVVTETESTFDANRKTPTLRIDNYWASELVSNIATKASIAFGQDVVDIFEKKLTEALDINGNDKWSVIWRHAIEEHEQNSSSEDVDDILLQAYRDALLAWYSIQRNDISENYLINAINSNYQVIQRTAIYVASKKFNLNTASKIILRPFFNDKYRHEMWLFLNNNFTQLNKPLKKELLINIEELTVKDEQGNLEEIPTAYKRSVWYSAIEEYDADAKTKYNKCIDITKQVPEHPSFACYTTVSAGRSESPISIVDLKIMLKEPEKMVKYLNGYKYVGHFNEEGLEGLIKNFGKLVEDENQHILKYRDHFLLLKPYYQHELFTIFEKLWNDNKSFKWKKNWPELLQFAKSLLKDDMFWNSSEELPYGSFIGNVNRVTSIVSQLIQAGCKKDDHAFEVGNIVIAKEILEIILERQHGQQFKLDDDAVTVAINSSRGRCLEAYLNLALFECRNLNNDAFHLDVWKAYEPVFSKELLRPDSNEYEFATLITMYLSNFSFLSKEWVSDHLTLMFGEVNSQRWLCAVQGYNYASGFSEDIYNLFKQKNFFEALFDNENLSDEAKGHYIERICLMHLLEKEQLNKEDDPLSLLLKRSNIEELSKVIWWLSAIYDNEFQKSQKLAFKLWPIFNDKVKIGDKHGQQLASKLSQWIVFIDNLNAEALDWLSAIAPYAGKNHNANIFLKGLAKLSNQSPIDVAKIWKLMLTHFSAGYADESIKMLFINLINSGSEGQRIAKEVADLYLTLGETHIISIYRKVTETR